MIGLSIAVVSLLPPSSDTSFHCGSAIFSYSSSKSNLALLQSCKTFGFVPVNSLFISRPHQTKFYVRQGNCFIFKSSNLALPRYHQVRLRWSLLTYHYYCALTNYIHPIGLEPDVMKVNLHYNSFKSLS